MSLDRFLNRAGEIAGQQQAGVTSGRKLVTAAEIGIMFAPDAPAHIRNARIWCKPSVAEWEAQAGEVLKALPSVDLTDKSKSTSTINPSITITRS